MEKNTDYSKGEMGHEIDETDNITSTRNQEQLRTINDLSGVDERLRKAALEAVNSGFNIEVKWNAPSKTWHRGCVDLRVECSSENSNLEELHQIERKFLEEVNEGSAIDSTSYSTQPKFSPLGFSIRMALNKE